MTLKNLIPYYTPAQKVQSRCTFVRASGIDKRPFFGFVLLAKLCSQSSKFASRKSDVIAHFTVKILNEAGVDLVLIQPFLLHYVNHVVLMLISIFEYNFHKKRKKVCIKTRPTSASRSLKGQDTKPTTVKLSIT